MSSESDRIRVGINFPKVGSSPSAIRQKLVSLADAGYDCVEVSLDMLPLIIGGEKRVECVDFLKSILKEFHLLYSAHIGGGVDLRDEKNPDIQKRVLLSSIEICGLLEMSPLVLHYEFETKDVRIEDRFVELHIEAANFALQHGVELCIENIEVERVDPVIRFLQRTDTPNLRMAFDTGHAFLAAGYFHFDFLEALEASLPFISHMHVSDNTGIFEELRITNRVAYDALSKTRRFAFGRGDIHLPPFWGEIPLDDVFRKLKDYRGIFICEYYSDYFIPFNRSIQERVRSAIQKARDHSG
jgi:sugar phosphate isomerase/epimerase